MSILRRIYDCKNQKVTPSPSHHHYIEAEPPMNRCARLTNSLGWLISLPFVLVHAVYNTAQLAKKQELAEPVLQAVDRSRPITPFPFLNMMLYILPANTSVFFKAPRHDTSMKGLFVDKVNHEVFLPILKDIISHYDQINGGLRPQGEITRSDFLLTALPEEALRYRSVILDFMGPKNHNHIRSELERIAEEMIEAIPSHSHMEDADVFCGTFTASIISRLFLNHPGPIEVYTKIHWAMQKIDQYSMQKRWGKLSAKQNREYLAAITIIAQAIKIAEESATPGSFMDTMKSRNFTDVQIKGTLFLIYLAGSGTTTTALKYLLWQLGQHPEYQKQIHERASPDEKKDLTSQAIAEALRLAPPIGHVGRFAAQDLRYTITDKGHPIYSYKIPKGSGVLIAQLPTALDPRRFDYVKDFHPERFKDLSSHQRLSWLPFGAGFHTCPGQYLALKELSIFVLSILQRYQVTSSPHQPDLKAYLFISLTHPTQVSLQFRPHPHI